MIKMLLFIVLLKVRYDLGHVKINSKRRTPIATNIYESR